LHFESYLEASRDAVRRVIASRNEEPGTKKVNTKLAQGIKQGKAQVYTNQVPSAGHLIVRLSCWQRNPNPNRRTFITVESNSYEVTGTSSDAQQIDLEFHEAKDLVDLKYGNAEGNKKGRALSKSQQKMKVTRQNLLDVQDLVVKHPIVLGDIQNFAVVSPQPFEFFKTRFGSEGNQPKDSSAKVILRDFVKLISRGREPDRQFVNKLNEIFLQGRKQREPFWEAIVEPMAISMCSIEFLMHFENKGKRSQASILPIGCLTFCGGLHRTNN